MYWAYKTTIKSLCSPVLQLGASSELTSPAGDPNTGAVTSEHGASASSPNGPSFI